MHGILLQPGERVVRVFRQTRLELVEPFVITALLLGIPWWYVTRFGLLEFRPWVALWSIVPVVYCLRVCILWSLQRYIITNKRLVKSHYNSLFKKVVVETPLERILNVSFKTTGIISVLGRFGDVEVQVVGLIDPVVLKSIIQPERIKEYLWRAHSESVKNKEFDPVHIQEEIGYTKHNQKVM